MANERKTVLGVSVDPRGAKDGFSQVKIDAKDMADSVKRSGQDASKGVGGIGDGAAAAAAKMDRATSSIVASIRRTTAAMEAGSTTSAKYYEALAAQRGVNVAALRPYLAQLEAVSGAQQKATASLQDFARIAGGGFGIASLSLAGIAASAVGLTKNLFDASVAAERLRIGLDFASGGRGAAEMGYITNLSNALGLSLEATAGAYKGFSAASRGTALEGAQTKAVFEAVSRAASVMGLSTDQSTGALLALQQMLSKGTVQAEELRGQLGERLPGAFQIAARAMGVTTQELGKMLETGQVLATDFLPKFAAQLESEIGGSAEKAANRLGAATNRMETSLFRLRAALGDSGIAAGFASGLTSTSGLLNMLASDVEKLNSQGALRKAAADLIELNARAETLRNGLRLGFFGPGFQSELDTVITKLATAKQRFRELDAASRPSDGRENFPSRGSRAAFDKQQADAALQADKDLIDVRRRLAGVDENYLKDLVKLENARRTGILTEKAYIAEVSRLATDTYKKSTAGKVAPKGTPADPFAAEREFAKQYADAFNDFSKIYDDATAKTDGLSKAQGRLVEYLASPAYQQHNEAMRQVVLQQAYAAVGAEQHADAEKRAAQAITEASAAWAETITGRQAAVKSLEAEIVKEREAAAVLGLSTAAVVALEAAKLEEMATSKDRRVALANEIDWTGELGQTYRDEAKALRDLAAAKMAGASKSAGIDAAKKTADEWQRTTDKIYSDLSDSLQRGFEKGKGFADGFFDSVEATAKRMVIEFAVKGTLSLATGQQNDSALSVLSRGGSGGSMSNLTNIAGAGVQYLTGASAGASTASLVGANAVGALGGDAIGTLAALNGGWAGVSAGAGAAGASAGVGAGAAAAGVGAAALSAIPYIGAAIAIYSMLSSSFKGETRTGGQYTNSNFTVGPSGGEISGDATRATLESTIKSINTTLTTLGASVQLKDLVSGLESSENGKGFAFAGGRLTNDKTFGQGNDGMGWQNRRGDFTQEQAGTAFAEELKQATLQALQAADVPGQLGDYLRQLGDIDQLSGGALDTALNRFNTALSQRTALEARYFELTATEAQKLAKARDVERAATDAFSKTLLESIYVREDQLKAVAGARNVLADAYETEKRALESTRDRVLGFGKTLKGFTDGLLTGNLSPLTPGQRYAELGSRYTILKAQASSGNADALEKFPEVAQQFLEASRVYNASGANYQSDFARVLADSEGMQSIAGKQYENSLKALSKLDLQVAGLIDIKGAVIKVEDAIKALAGVPGAGTIDPIVKLYQELLGRAPDAEGGAYFRAMLATNKTEAEIRASIMNSPEYKQRMYGIPLATGLDRVPYDGFRATLHAEETVLNREAAQAWRAGLSGGNDSAATRALIEEVKQLRTELRSGLQQHAMATSQVTIDAHARTADAIVSGTTAAVTRANFESKNKPVFA